MRQRCACVVIVISLLALALPPAAALSEPDTATPPPRWYPTPKEPEEAPAPVPESLDTHPDVAADYRGFSDRQTGAFSGFGVLVGPAWIGNGGVGSDAGWSLLAQFRVSQVLSLADFQLDYRFAQYDTDSSGDALGVSQHAFCFGAAFHPLFLLNVGSKRLAYFAASLYIRAGLGVSVTDVRLPARGVGDWEANFTYNFGTGLDFPVSDPNVPWNFWFGAHYLHNRTPVDLAPFSDSDFSEHLLFFSFSLRNNGFIF